MRYETYASRSSLSAYYFSSRVQSGLYEESGDLPQSRRTNAAAVDGKKAISVESGDLPQSRRTNACEIGLLYILKMSNNEES
jgi:hypothetical protein